MVILTNREKKAQALTTFSQVIAQEIAAGGVLPRKTIASRWGLFAKDNQVPHPSIPSAELAEEVSARFNLITGRQITQLDGQAGLILFDPANSQGANRARFLGKTASVERAGARINNPKKLLGE